MQVFFWEFSEILKNNFFAEHLRRTACGHLHSLNNLTVFLQSSELIETRLFRFANMFYHGHQAWWISWALHLEKFRSSLFCKKGVLRNFEKFTEQHMCQSLFFNKVAGLTSATLLKKRLWHSCFPVNFCESSKNNFSYRTPPVAASETLQNKRPIETAVRIRSSKKVFLKISQISQVFSRENCELLTFLQNNSGDCFLTQLLLHRKTRISLR